MASNDLISRRKLDGMRLAMLDFVRPDQHTKGWNECITYIQQSAPAVDPASTQIDVGDRLPEYGRYLVVTQKGNGMPKVHTATYNHLGWWTHCDFGEITHRMPLPEPQEERFS